MSLFVAPNCQTIFCVVRKQWIAATPEEQIRQRLILYMTQELGYSLSHIALEKPLHQIVPAFSSLPKRRIDLVVFAPNLHPLYPLYPLLLIECKAVKITNKMIRQLLGYQYYLRSCFFGLVNKEETYISYFDSTTGNFQTMTSLPSCDVLLEQGRKRGFINL